MDLKKCADNGCKFLFSETSSAYILVILSIKSTRICRNKNSSDIEIGKSDKTYEELNKFWNLAENIDIKYIKDKIYS